jgi:hypothetical protein
MSQHTPTPWEVSDRNWRGEKDDSGNLYVRGDRHDCVATDDDGNDVPDGEAVTAVAIVCGNATSGAVTAANADLLRRAVNAHADLLDLAYSFVGVLATIRNEHPWAGGLLAVAKAAIARAEPRA